MGSSDREGDPKRPVALVLRALGLGDLLTATPALRGIRRALPDHRIVLAMPAPLAALLPAINVDVDVLPTEGLAPLPWAGPPPDLAVDLHGKGPESHRLLLDVVPPERLVAFGCVEVGVAGPVWRGDEHEVARWGRLVGESFRVPAEPADLDLVPPAPPVDGSAGAVVIHPGAASGARRWPAERFGTVARWATDEGLPVVITGGPEEVGLARQVAEAAGLPPYAVRAGGQDLAELAATLAHARLLICGDTGVAHLATGFRTPSVVLFGPISPRLWGPPERPDHVVIWYGDDAAPGDPHAATPDPALLRITPTEVIAACTTLIAHRPTPPAETARMHPFCRRVGAEVTSRRTAG